mmetsp:Transcript_2426/g.3664  ORF Transcript_2426/g.3664 Transcript_2426/m.3664 type:complete len:266 (-) Transcript_2426:753-1550(-)|eukprot:CAMPEP_0197233974 /NCGR_PEP_ID=MMETSP1429-20130617/1859_1 /TAXON_ID=49237 /ORGANISM="Chaetoceros  sp., Strain UNC1202" /LENGTH=265 /DNA_ID=CAMNT_0042692297 /DNA_START=50 /DNA_END=847 /DNA_ORIENTATION=+
MKIHFVLFSLYAATANAGINAPSVVIDLKGLQDGSSCPFEGLDPEMSWSASTSCSGCDLEAGATSSIKPTLEVLSLPRSIWGTVRRDVAGWALAAKTSVALDGSDDLDVAVKASNDDLDTSVQIVSSGGGQKIRLNKGFEAGGGRVTVSPRYNTKTSVADAIIAYETDDTSITIEAAVDNQKVSVARQITDNDLITPSVNSDGDISLAWRKSLDDGNAVTTTVKVNDSVSVEWEDGPWTATIDAPLDGVELGGVNVKVNRKVSFV